MKKSKTEKFIEKAKNVEQHKEKNYDYSLVKYINNTTKIKIICSIHGEFEQTPAGHLVGKGCQICGININTMSLDKFLIRANSIHNNKYDYSNVIYINSYTKVKIICPEHGAFEQTPSGHLCGYNCKECSKLTTKKFIQRAEIIHNNKYDYSKTEYINCKTKVIIICPEHGKFLQVSDYHLQGSGCVKCIGNEKSTTEEFIKKAKIIHNYKYDYNSVNYVSCHEKVKIICPKHGEFLKSPANHLSGQGCVICAKQIPKINMSSTEKFIESSLKIHGDKYDYSKVNYILSNIKVNIICKIHGEFMQVPNSHLRCAGCPKCKFSKGEVKIEKTLNENNIEHINQRKFKYCKNIKELPFDFYLPKYNICIEYDGIQHYKSVKRFGGKKSLIETQKNDQIKTNYCLNNNIKLIRIPYWNFKNIEQILEKELQIVHVEN